MFSPDNSIYQHTERIIITDHGDGTISAILQIGYEGEAEDFAWVLPIPEAIPAEAVQAVDDGAAAFDELQQRTNPRYFPPERPDCLEFGGPMAGGAPNDGAAGGSRGVEVFGSGETGPYSYDIIGSDDPTALITWLRDHDYAVTPAMEPIIQTYVDMGMSFLAMRLLPDEDVSAVQPVQVTFHTAQTMIPMQMAAVAAVENMNIIVWFFSDRQAAPANFERIEVPDEAIRFDEYGSSNYETLLDEHMDAAGGHGFITEFAGPSNTYEYHNPLVNQLAAEHPYLTRLRTIMSPDQMTLDPMFEWNGDLPDVDNNHTIENEDAWDISCTTTQEFTQQVLIVCGVVAILSLVALGAIFGLVRMLRRRQQNAPPAA
jgi:hypothetical protein